MSKLERFRDPYDRRKAKWELTLNPLVTAGVLLFCVGILAIWIGLFERRFSPENRFVTSTITGMADWISSWIRSIV
jgi:hypothetical protein